MQVIGKPITIYVDTQVLTALDTWTKEHDLSRSKAIRNILLNFFEGDNK